MALPPPIDADVAPAPSMMRTASSEGSVELRHPTPDTQSAHGGVGGPVEKLEEHAERMSMNSNIAEEIRRLNLEQKLADSRRSSLLSGAAEEPRAPSLSRSRNVSQSSFSNSIVDVNTAARWGGYSPGGYVTSPIGSIRSGSWSRAASVQRERQLSTSKASRFENVTTPESEQPQFLSTTSPASHTSPNSSRNLDPQSQALRIASDSSFANEYNQIAQDIQNQLDRIPSQEEADTEEEGTGEKTPLMEPAIEGASQQQLRPMSAASGATFHQGSALFHDFDGVHYEHSNRDPTELRSEFGGQSRQSSGPPMLRALSHEVHGEPPPGDDMVYYPAPVPRLLNLPKRLSQIPPQDIQAKRRSQFIQNMQPEARKSAVWLAGQEPTSGRPRSLQSDSHSGGRQSMDRRRGTANLAELPPQLRASMYFDHQAIPQGEVQVKGESVVNTLDSILDASATAPVGVFTDHPFAGRAGNVFYAKNANKVDASTSSLTEAGNAEKKKKRSSFFGLMGRRSSTSSTDLLAQNGKLRKRNSRMSMNMENMEEAKAGEEGGDLARAEKQRLVDQAPTPDPLRQQADDGSVNGDEQAPDADAGEEEEQFAGKPTTLLAELQMRKAQQRQRNRPAATAFPNGMHSTLLEMDAVAEVEKKKRHGRRVALAWEDPEVVSAEADEDDDDVPLGLLYSTGKTGLINKNKNDSDRPLGLMEKREMEDNEPLSRRRHRLLGVGPDRREPSPAKRGTAPLPKTSPSQIALDQPEGQADAKQPQAEEEQEGETLGQRKRRMRDSEVLNRAVGEIDSRPLSRTFSSELLGEFGIGSGDPEGANEDQAINRQATPGEEETLGQRRARLRAEAQGIKRQSNSPQLTPNGQSQPGIRASRSMADILATVPAKNSARKVSNDALVSALPTGSLLAQNEKTKARQRRDLHETNKRSSSYGLEKPLVDVGKGDDPFAHLNHQQFSDNLPVDESIFRPGNQTAATTPGANLGMGIGLNASTPMLGMGFNPAMMGMEMANMNMFGMNGMNGMTGFNGMNPYFSTTPFGNPAFTGSQMNLANMGTPQMPMGNGTDYSAMMAQMQQMQQFQQPQAQPQPQPATGLGLGGGAPQLGMTFGNSSGMSLGALNMGGPVNGPTHQRKSSGQKARRKSSQMMPMSMMDGEEPMDRGQRDLIDRWRQSVHP